MSLLRVRRTSHFGCTNCRSALAAAVGAGLVLGCTVLVPAQQAAGPDANPAPSAQATPVPSAQAQTSDSSADQSQTAASAVADARKLNCQQPANPNKRRFGCKDKDFSREETLTAEWNGARTEAKKLGITPSASYYSALQTNVSGGPHQTWGYTGQ